MPKREPPVWEVLRRLGARMSRDRKKFIIDEVDTEFYFLFDVSEDPETPEAKGTADIILRRVGAPPNESCDGFRVIANANEMRIIRFLYELGVQRFSDDAQLVLREINRPIKLK